MNRTGLTLHAVRILGFADIDRVAARFDLDPDDVADKLRWAETYRWVAFSSFSGSTGWSLTSRGRREGERHLAEESVAVGAVERARATLEAFAPLNALVRQACTDWQLRPAPDDPLAANDHSDPEWDAGVLLELGIAERALPTLLGPLEELLPVRRLLATLCDSREPSARWRGAVGREHGSRLLPPRLVRLHEDLLATNGMRRT